MKKKILAYVAITRPQNALLASIGVALGFWLTKVSIPLIYLPLLLFAAIGSLGFGNIINDIKDVTGDRINHPERPLPQGVITKREAQIFATILAILALFTGGVVSWNHLIGVTVPLILLTVYTLTLKGTPLVGNIVVSLLVAYTLIFGSLSSESIEIVIIPSVLAFLLNLCREIIKDVQDYEGDTSSGVRTTASLPNNLIKGLMGLLGVVYLLLVGLPYLLGHFKLIYLLICLVIALPIHLYWLGFLVLKQNMANPKKISGLIKIEMLIGLSALAFDALIVG